MVGGMAEYKRKQESGGQEAGMKPVMVAAATGGRAKETCYEHTLDGSVDLRGYPATKQSSGVWVAGALLLVNQGLATLAFFGVNVNLVLFLTRVLRQNNADAANDVSKWTGTVYIFSLIGAFLSDSYWGRFKTCAVFQLIFVFGLGLLSLSSHLFLIKPSGCGDNKYTPCAAPSNIGVGLFYLSIYMIALGNGGYQPNIASFGADQFDAEDPKEARSKISFFSYFYLALNLGSLFSNTFLSFLEDHGMWALGFWASTASALVGLVLFLCGTPTYRHFKPGGNPLSRICQVAVAASRKWRAPMPQGGGDDLYELDEKEPQGTKRLFHSEGFKFLDRAAMIGSDDFLGVDQEQSIFPDPWRLCTVTQVEEVKCVLRLLPIWLCTIPYSVVFTQMASLFVVQGAAMDATVGSFSIPPSSMSAFDILSVAAFIFFSRGLIHPIACKLTKSPKGLNELQRMGVGLIIAVLAMISAATVEHFRLRHAKVDDGTSTLHIMWQVPQYALIGASEVFMYVGQLEFFNGQAPDGLKSFGSALCMTSMSLGNFVSDLLVTVVMKITAKGGRPGWIPADLDEGHLGRFYFLLAGLVSVDFVVYVFCAKRYKSIRLEGKGGEDEESSSL